MTRFGYTLMTEQSGPKERVVRPAGRAARVRLRGVERPLLAVADRAGPRAVRVDDARRGRPGHRAGRPDDLRDLPDPALPPGRGGAEGGDAADPGRRPVHARPRQRREPQRARRRAALARHRGRARRCCWRRSHVIRRLHTGELVDHRGPHFQVDSARIWDLPEQGVDLAVAVSGERSIETFAPLADHLVAVEPDAEAIDTWNATDGAPRIGDGARAIGQIPICWGHRRTGREEVAREQFRWFAGGWSVNADLPDAGRVRRRQPVRHRRRRRRVDPVRPGPRRDGRGGLGLLEGRLHRHRTGAGRRRPPGRLPRPGCRSAAGEALRAASAVRPSHPSR